MKRREFLKNAGLGAAATAVACTSSAPSEQSTATPKGKKIRWRLASSFPRALDTIFGCAEVFSERLKAMTDGQFDVRVHPAGGRATFVIRNIATHPADQVDGRYSVSWSIFN